MEEMHPQYRLVKYEAENAFPITKQIGQFTSSLPLSLSRPWHPYSSDNARGKHIVQMNKYGVKQQQKEERPYHKIEHSQRTHIDLPLSPWQLFRENVCIDNKQLVQYKCET